MVKNDKIVEVLQLNKMFYDFWGRPKVQALSDLSFAVHQGEIFGLLGPNGSGKTTAIKLLLGLLFPTSGRIRVFGRSPRNVKVKRHIGFLPEESYLYPYQNAQEALTFYGRLFSLPGKLLHKRVEDLLDMVGLQRARKRPLREYSKGMTRRIGIAQALINDPQLVVLDEPTSGLDPIGTREIKDLIVELKEHGKTVILCSHLLADVEDVCDHVQILYAGRKVCEGKIGQLLSNQSTTQITTERMSEEVIAKLENWLVQQGIGNITIGTPKERLETFFLREIERARLEQPDTQGAMAGKQIEGFFTSSTIDGEPKRENQVIEQLLKPKATGDSPSPEEEVEQKTPDIVQSLVKSPAPAPEQTAEPENNREKSKNEVLDKLTKRGK